MKDPPGSLIVSRPPCRSHKPTVTMALMTTSTATSQARSAVAAGWPACLGLGAVGGAVVSVALMAELEPTSGSDRAIPRRGKGIAKTSTPPVVGRHAGGVRLLVVEDDDAIAVPLVEGLERAGFTTNRVATGADALVNLDRIDLVLLDLGLPDMDGSEVCRRVRSESAVPIIIVTARGDESERVLGLELGADDYIVKPFGLRELIARVRAVGRRSGSTHEVERPQQIGSLEIDRRTRRVA